MRCFKLQRIIKITLIFALVIFYSCQKDNFVDVKNEQDELLTKLESKITSIQFEQLKSSTIGYSAKVDKYSKYAKDISDKAKAIFIVYGKYPVSENTKNVDKKIFLNSQPRPNCFKNPMNDFEKSIMKTTFKLLVGKNNSESLQILNVLEGFIYENICNQDQQERFFYIIASIRQSYYNDFEYSSMTDNIAKLKSAEIYERSCWNACMNDTWNGYNTVDWIQFWIFPAETFLWESASCAWDCAF